MTDPKIFDNLALGAIALMSALTVFLQQKSAARIASKQEAIAKVVDNTHVLVNSQFGIQLLLVATSARSLANITHLPKDIAAADLADSRLLEHQQKQAIVDANPAGPASAS